MFEINNFENNIVIEELKNSKIFIIDNFYIYPEKIVDLIYSIKATLHKQKETPSYNGIHFFDERPTFLIEENKMRKELINVRQKLSSLCNQTSLNEDYLLANSMKLVKNKFNDYKNNYWWPHFDIGYSSLIYLNKDSFVGTNFYDTIEKDNIEDIPEHYSPWRKKSKFKVIKKIESRFNRMVLFNGKFLLHGMAVEDDKFFQGEKRINQVYFFEGKKK